MLLLSTSTLSLLFFSLVSALDYELPQELVELAANSNCTYPGSFTVSQFAVWTPSNTSNTTTTTNTNPNVNFTFADVGTGIAPTPCRVNATSTSTTAGQAGLAPRWACDDARVSFIWQAGTLTLIEAVCPGQAGTKFEASGSVTPANLTCVATDCSFSGAGGDGQLCSAPADLSARFTSLQPSPLGSGSGA